MLSEQKFENFLLMGRFSTKKQKVGTFLKQELNLVRIYYAGLKRGQSEKKLVKQQYLLHMSSQW